MNMKAKLFQPSEEMLRIRALLEQTPPGAYLTYDDIAKAAKVPMNIRGKSIMRSAAHSLNLNYRVDPGKGIEVESPSNTMGIVTSRVRRVDSSLKRAGKVSRTLLERHLDKMPAEDRPRLTAVASLLGAVSAVAGGLRRLYSTKPEALNTVQNTRIEWKPK